MITTTRQRRASHTPTRRYPRLLFQLLLLILLASCTNSKLLVGPLYNQLDDKILSRINKLGDFNDEQTAALEQAVGTFHVWHRQSELPQYAALLQEIASSITVPELTTENDVGRWLRTAEGFSRKARECYPVNFMTGTIRTLSDEQISTIQKRFTSERRENRERHGKRSSEERVAFRLKNLEKWAGRINLQLTQTQRDSLRDSLSRQISLREQYHVLSDTWNEQLFDMARDQEASDYETRMQVHLGKFSTLLETAYPEQWQANRQLWQETLQSFIQSLDAEQRRNVSQWVGKMGKTLEAVSRDTPSFTPGNDASVGCLVANGS